MKKIIYWAVSLFIFSAFASCADSADKTKCCEASDSLAPKPVLVSAVMTTESREAMSADSIIADLLAGNERYTNNALTLRDLKAQVAATTEDQFPKAVILACIDSRVPVEYIFDQGVGDIFVARVAGNIEDEDVLGSIEYSVGVAGSKVVMVLGHESCGAVKSAVKKLDVGSQNVTHLLSQIEPAIAKIPGERDYHNHEYMHEVILENVRLTVADIRARSKITADLEKEGKVKIVGAYYDLHTGKVEIVK